MCLPVDGRFARVEFIFGIFISDRVVSNLTGNSSHTIASLTGRQAMLLGDSVGCN